MHDSCKNRRSRLRLRQAHGGTSVAHTQTQIPAQPTDGTVVVPVAPGELVDKITILELKSERLTDPRKLQYVWRELRLLTAARAQAIPTSPALNDLTARLRAVNAALWQIEDELRIGERQQDLGPRFIALARSVYQHNDERAALKQRINGLLNAPFREQKSYAAS